MADRRFVAIDTQLDATQDIAERGRWSALQRLHGVDLVWTDQARTKVRHGGDGDHVHSMPEIRQALTAWRSACAEYEADPAGFVQRMKEAARSATAE